MILKVYYYVIVKRLTRGASSVKIPDIFLYLFMFLISNRLAFLMLVSFFIAEVIGHEATEIINAMWQACAD